MVMGQHFQVMCCPLLLYDFRQFNIKGTPAHHSIFQEEVDELLTKGAIDPSSGGAGFYSNLFVVPQHIGGLHPILKPKPFSCYMHIATFKVPTIRWIWALIQQGNYAFSIYLKDASLLPLFSISVVFYILFCNTNHICGSFAFLSGYNP